MIRLECPTSDSTINYDLARSRRQQDASGLLEACRSSVLAGYANYQSAGASARALPAADLDKDTAAALRTNFDLLDTGRSMSSVRVAVLAAAIPASRRCPMCSISRASSIDHYLPRSLYPEFSILVENLIPVCDRCNLLKGSRCTTVGNGTFFHAYFDDPHRTVVLTAEIRIGHSVGVSYNICREGGVDPSLVEIFESHLSILDLYKEFGSQAATALMDGVGSFELAFDGGSPAGLHRFLTREAKNYGDSWGLNSWQAALYRAAAASEEFCSGGFRRLLQRRVQVRID